MSSDIHNHEIYHQKVKRIEYVEEPLVERLPASGLSVIEASQKDRYKECSQLEESSCYAL